MDQLISGLGYLDYWDFLAANKYVMEAKKSTDSYQRARGEFLEKAFNLLDEQRKKDLEVKWEKEKNKLAENDLEEMKLQDMLKEDGINKDWFEWELLVH